MDTYSSLLLMMTVFVLFLATGLTSSAALSSHSIEFLNSSDQIEVLHLENKHKLFVTSNNRIDCTFCARLGLRDPNLGNLDITIEQHIIGKS